jgi:ABC-type multidrug transport system fused ATPase/permease subunit
MQSIFSFFRLSLFIDFTEHTLANLRHPYIVTCKVAYVFFSQKRVGELNSRISSDITQIQDTLTSTSLNFKTAHFVGGVALLATESIKLTLLMLSVVPLVAVAAVILVGSFENLQKVFKIR